MSVPFKLGERIALPYLPILKIEGDVAVLKKTRIVVEDGCGQRHKARAETPFMLRGGFKVERIVRYKVPSWAFTVTFETPWGTTRTENVPRRAIYLDHVPDNAVLAEKFVKDEYGIDPVKILDIKMNEQIKSVNVYTRKFKHAVVEIPEDDYFIHIRRERGENEADTYFIYEFVSGDEAKLVDDVSRIDYVLYIFSHSLQSRSARANIKILSGDVIWSSIRNTSCANASNAVAIIIARHKSRLAIAKNTAPYRGPEEWIIEEWESSFPSPRLINRYNTADPVVTDLAPEDIV
jgi:hypothetical protein